MSKIVGKKNDFMNNVRIDNLKNIINKSFEEKDLVKYFEHTERVVGYTKLIMFDSKFDSNDEFIIAAAWIHDIGRIIDNTFLGHIKELSNAATTCLSEAGYNINEIEDIINIANKHHPEQDEIIETVEAQIIFDADNLDLIGAIGLMRWFDCFPTHTLDLASSAKLFIDIYNTQIQKIESFFYTNAARIIGTGRLMDMLEYCRKTIEEVDLIYDYKQYNLSTCQLYSFARDNDRVNNSRDIILLAGFRCSGKSYAMSLLEKTFGSSINCFSTNSICTGDKDANTIGPKKVIKRYGKKGTYLWFIKDHLLEYYKNTKGTIVIDSIKSDKDLFFLKELFPNDNLYVIWFHSCFKTRSERYTNRDIIPGVRNMPLQDHDAELIDLGILSVMKEADYIINTNQSTEALISEICKILASFCSL